MSEIQRWIHIQGYLGKDQSKNKDKIVNPVNNKFRYKDRDRNPGEDGCKYEDIIRNPSKKHTNTKR